MNAANLLSASSLMSLTISHQSYTRCYEQLADPARWRRAHAGPVGSAPGDRKPFRSKGVTRRDTPAPEGASAPPPPGGSGGPADLRSRTERGLGAITIAGGLLCAAGGLTVMAAWFARATAILRFGGQHSMAFNTAAAVTVTGVALIALARGRRERGAGGGRLRTRPWGR